MIAIFGGTFDPVHFGHLRLAQELGSLIAADSVLFVPAGNPPHRAATVAPAQARVAMLERGLAGNPRFRLDQREIRKATPSYTIETLTELRAESGNTPLALLLGSDAFTALAGWHRWRELFDLAHIVVAHRPGPAADWRDHLPSQLGEETAQRLVQDAASLKNRPAGHILVHAITALDISASNIRRLICSRQSAQYLLPDSVIDYIQSEGLYSTGETTLHES